MFAKGLLLRYWVLVLVVGLAFGVPVAHCQETFPLNELNEILQIYETSTITIETGLLQLEQSLSEAEQALQLALEQSLKAEQALEQSEMALQESAQQITDLKTSFSAYKKRGRWWKIAAVIEAGLLVYLVVK